MANQHPVDWEDVLWREWRHTADRGYARLIYDSLANRPAPAEACPNVPEQKSDGATLGCVWVPGLVLFGLLCRTIAYYWWTKAPAVYWSVVGFVVAAVLGANWWSRSRRRDETRDPAPVTWHDVLAAHEAVDAVRSDHEPDPTRPFPLSRRQYLPLWKKPATHAEVREAFRHPDAPDWARSIASPPDPPTSPMPLLDALGGDDAVARRRARYWLVELGGESLPPLCARALRGGIEAAEAARLVDEIISVLPTSKLPHPSHWLCGRCLVRVGKRRARAGQASPRTYVGCRSCGATRDLIEHPGPVVAVLDQADWERESRDGVLRVNWLTRARANGFDGLDLFDFDRVEIVNASDQDVRHFLVDVTSDTDEKRRKRYRTMQVTVASDCDLSPNTMKALNECFPGM